MTVTSLHGDPEIVRPWAFTAQQLDWVPWLEPRAAQELSPRQIEALVQPQRANSPYFRLLADDPDILEARTRADLEIFHSPGGLPRAEREVTTISGLTMKQESSPMPNWPRKSSRRRPSTSSRLEKQKRMKRFGGSET